MNVDVISRMKVPTVNSPCPCLLYGLTPLPPQSYLSSLPDNAAQVTLPLAHCRGCDGTEDRREGNFQDAEEKVDQGLRDFPVKVSSRRSSPALTRSCRCDILDGLQVSSMIGQFQDIALIWDQKASRSRSLMLALPPDAVWQLQATLKKKAETKVTDMLMFAKDAKDLERGRNNALHLAQVHQSSCCLESSCQPQILRLAHPEAPQTRLETSQIKENLDVSIVLSPSLRL